jgi:hypothetical protein
MVDGGIETFMVNGDEGMLVEGPWTGRASGGVNEGGDTWREWW